MRAPIKAWDLSGICCSKVRGILRKIMFGVKSVFFDLNYYPINASDLIDELRIWRANILPKLRYEKDRWDCDDFAEYFASWIKLKTNTNCCGMVIGTVVIDYGYARLEAGHAWNSVLVSSGKSIDVVFVEPQLGIVVPPNQPIQITKEVTESSIATIRTRMRTAKIGKQIEYRPEFFIW